MVSSFPHILDMVYLQGRGKALGRPLDMACQQELLHGRAPRIVNKKKKID